MSTPHHNNLKERAAQGLVTHDNTGGYFVVECQGCSAVYPSFQCVGGGQIADTGDYDDARCPHCDQEAPEECDNVGLAWNTQQERINAIQRRLNTVDQKADDLSFQLNDREGSRRSRFDAAQAAEKRVEVLLEGLTSANADKEAYAQNAIGLREQLESARAALRTEVEAGDSWKGVAGQQKEIIEQQNNLIVSLRAELVESYSTDAQHQGEPVACMPVERCYDVRAKMIIAFNEAKKAGGDLDDALDAAYKSALRYSPNPMSAEQPAPVAGVPNGYCIIPKKLTAENGAKALLLGEFKLQSTHECPECRELEEPSEGCEICDGEGEYGQKHTIPWDQIKFIYSKAVKGLAVKAEPAKS